MGDVSYRKWDILLADVPFEDIEETKLRPVLVLGGEAHLLDCLKMTSQQPRSGEYVLKNWSAAGLHKSTTVRLSKRLDLDKCRVRKKIGALHPVDIIEIQNMLK